MSSCRHVNRKALDEYASFTEQKTELKRRQEENARGEAKIKQLIQTLDLRKDEAIERTFKVGFSQPLCTTQSSLPSRRACISASSAEDKAIEHTFEAGLYATGGSQPWLWALLVLPVEPGQALLEKGAPCSLQTVLVRGQHHTAWGESDWRAGRGEKL